MENDKEQNSCYQTTDAWRDTGEAGQGHAPSSYSQYNRLTQDEIKRLSTDDELKQDSPKRTKKLRTE